MKQNRKFKGHKKFPSLIRIQILFLLLLPALPLALAQPIKPTNPFRNLPKNPDNNTTNPFHSNSTNPPPAYPPPSGGEPTYESPSNSYEGGGDNFGTNYESPSPSGGSGGNEGDAGGSSLKPGDQLIMGQKKPQNNARDQEVVTNFDYPNAEILDVAKAIAKLTGRNFIYNPQDVKGRVSIVSETPIKVEDAWKAFLTGLDMRGFTIIPSGEYLRIERSQAAKEKQVPIYAGKFTPDSDEYITRVLPLKYISAKEVENSFRLWVPRQARLYAHEQTNTLIITDTASHIRAFMELIALLDVAGFQESLAVIPVRYAAAKDIAKIIEQITGLSSSGRTQAGIRPGGVYPPRPPGFGDSGREGSSSITQIIPDERTNSLVVKANRTGHEEVRELVRKLDTQRSADENGGRIHVVRLQFADAEDIAKSLGAIVKDKGTSSSSSPARVNTFPSYPGAPGGDGVASLFQGEIKVSPDTTTQSLVVTAAPQDFQTLKRVIEQLDIPRDQVFVEAVIMELNMSNTNGFGVSFINPRNGIAFPSKNLLDLIQGNPANGLSLGFRQGSTIEYQLPGGSKVNISNLQGLVELLQSTGNSHVLARPQLIALDNQEATVEISDEVPIANVTTNVNNSQSFSFQKDKASLTMKVKPHINKASDFVRLEIEQTLEEFNSAIVPRESQGKAVGKSSRQTKTSVVVQNEDTIVISGLIRSKEEETVNKVPLLGDIPVLGWLFKNSRIQRTKTDLVIFITPRIVKQYEKVRAILTDRMQERVDFVNQNLGGDDPQSATVRALKKRLPDLSKLQPLASPTAEVDSASFHAPARPNEEQKPQNPTNPLNPNAQPQPPGYDQAPGENGPTSPIWKDPANPGVSGGVPLDPSNAPIDSGGDSN